MSSQPLAGTLNDPSRFQGRVQSQQFGSALFVLSSLSPALFPCSSIIHCAHVQRKHCQAERLGGECSHGSCNAASGPVAAQAGLGSARLSLARPYTALLARGKENTFSWAIDPLVNVVCSCVCAQKCNYRTRWERWSLGNMSVTPHTFSAPTTALHHFFLSSCFHKLFFFILIMSFSLCFFTQFFKILQGSSVDKVME